MKKVSFIFVALMGMVAASCGNEESLDSSINPSSEHGVAPVTVSVSGFSVEQGDFPGTGGMTRAQAVGDNTNVKFLTLAFYSSNGTEVYKHTQEKGNLEEGETFGEFSTSLMYGSYIMVVLANGGNNAITLTSPTVATYGENNTKDTWAYTQPVNITSNTAVELSATLDRICTLLVVQSTDNRPAEVTHMRLTLSAGAKSFSPTTGQASSNTGFSMTMAFPDATVGSTAGMGTYLFLATDEQTINVTIETLDAADGNVLFSKTITDVPFIRNRQTKLTGAIFSGTGVSGGSFLVNTDWITAHNINF